VVGDGGPLGLVWRLDEVTERRLRLYRADMLESWILDPDSAHDVRVGVDP
jgi:hypothetical protein